MKVIISHNIGEEVLYCGGLLNQEEPVFIIYMAVSDLDSPFHITPNFIKEIIKKQAGLLDFNYEIVFQGRQFYNKLDVIPQAKLESIIIKRT